MANVSDHTKCISLNNQPCMTISYDEYNQGLIYYPFMVNLDRCNWSWNTIHDPSGKICAANKTEDLNLNVLI